MNLLDLFILIPVVWGCVRGFSKGLIMELATLAGLILGIIAAWYFAGTASEYLRQYFTFGETTARIISYVAIFIVVMLLAYLIGKIIEKTVDLIALGWLNKILGAIVGLIKGAIVAGLLVFVIVSLDHGEKLITPQVKEKSMFYGFIEKQLASIVTLASRH